jgi:hypothetical protein
VAGKCTMNGNDIKKAAINKAKQVAQAANSNSGKKRRKGQDLYVPRRSSARERGPFTDCV